MTLTPHKTKAEAVQSIKNVDIVAEQPASHSLGKQTLFLFLFLSAFAPGHCYEPFVKYGNLTSSDSTWAVGAVVEFACNPGYTLEQGSVTIECMDPDNPQWNETEPACRGLYICTRLH